MPTTDRFESAGFASISIDSVSARAIARGAGDLTVAVRSEIVNVLKKNKGHQLKALFAGLDHMKKVGHITDDECSSLKKLCELAFDFDRKKTNASTALSDLSAIHQQVLVDAGASPAALAIASSVAAMARSTDRSTLPATSTSTAVAAAVVITPGNAATGAAIGGVIGGVIGGIVGGGLGAGLGAAIGAAAGAAIGACND